MKQQGESPVLAVAVAVVVMLVGAWPCVAQATPPDRIDDEVLRFRWAASRAGFVVQEGLPVKTSLNDLYCDGSMWAPLYPNPNSALRYFVWAMRRSSLPAMR